ncbi:conserved hypothetical protein [Ricinus communis]|uniref:Uncharacterized protein n=1 Tax=Ricinus communis TaxID=3988 RepID=B9RSG0_RICCO|nr:conserved hypothetical protein [Ricinus communis]
MRLSMQRSRANVSLKIKGCNLAISTSHNTKASPNLASDNNVDIQLILSHRGRIHLCTTGTVVRSRAEMEFAC